MVWGAVRLRLPGDRLTASIHVFQRGAGTGPASILLLEVAVDVCMVAEGVSVVTFLRAEGW